jgi:hypothetical protein
MRYLLLSVLVVCVIGTISMVPVALAYSGLEDDDDGITLEEHLELATKKVEDNPPTASPIGPNFWATEEGQIAQAELDREREKIMILEWLIWIFLIVVPIALVILVVIAIKKMRRKK